MHKQWKCDHQNQFLPKILAFSTDINSLEKLYNDRTAKYWKYRLLSIICQKISKYNCQNHSQSRFQFQKSTLIHLLIRNRRFFLEKNYCILHLSYLLISLLASSLLYGARFELQILGALQFFRAKRDKKSSATGETFFHYLRSIFSTLRCCLEENAKVFSMHFSRKAK